MNPALAAVVLIVLHNVDGDEITINPEHVVVLHPTTESDRQGKPNTLVTKGVNCVVGLSNGKFISVVESCATVRAAMEKAQ